MVIMKSAQQRYPGTLLFSRPALGRSNMTTESQLKLDLPQLVLEANRRKKRAADFGVFGSRILKDKGS